MKNLLIFLDYDGTLTPIVKKPHLAKLSKARKKLLQKIAGVPHVMVVVISGRMLSDLKKLVGISQIYYAGNHGFEISGPKTKFVHPRALKAKPVLQKIKKELSKRLKGIKGFILEDKKLTLSLHYRLVKEKDYPKIKTIFDEAVAPFIKSNKVRITHGKKVFEVRPDLAWDKGHAVEWFLSKKAKKKKAFPIYIGDDTTDEDAFKVLRHRGLTIRVGRAEETHAEQFAKDVNHVYKLLKFLALEI